MTDRLRPARATGAIAGQGIVHVLAGQAPTPSRQQPLRRPRGRHILADRGARTALFRGGRGRRGRAGARSRGQPRRRTAPPRTRAVGSRGCGCRWRSRLRAASFGSAAPTPQDSSAGPARSGAGRDSLLQAPLPGRVVRIAVAPATPSTSASTLVVVEAMKIETAVVGAPRWDRRGGPLRRRRGRRRWSGAGRVSPTMTAPEHDPATSASRAGTPTTRLTRCTTRASTSTTLSRRAGRPTLRSRAPSRQAFTFRSPGAVDPHLLLVFDSIEALEAWRLWLARYWKARPYLSVHDNVIAAGESRSLRGAAARFHEALVASAATSSPASRDPEAADGRIDSRPARPSTLRAPVSPCSEGSACRSRPTATNALRFVMLREIYDLGRRGGWHDLADAGDGAGQPVRARRCCSSTRRFASADRRTATARPARRRSTRLA